MNKFICIDIGGTAIKSGILNAAQEILFQQETPTKASEGGPVLAKQVYDIVCQLKEKEPAAAGIAISTAGVINSQTTEILYASSAIPAYKGVCYKDVLRPLGLPVEAENDVNCAGLAEYSSGSAKGASSALILTVGTGIGGCFILNGQLLNGSSYSACEVGYLPMQGGMFQDLASTTTLVQNVAQAKGEEASQWDGRKIFEGASGGDVICQSGIDQLCDRLAEGMAALCFVLNPEVVVLGGGIMAQKAVLEQPIKKYFAAHSIPLIADATRIEFASHENTAGMKGALAHFLVRHPMLAN